MTCIVGMERGRKVYLAGDSAGTNQILQQVSRADEKVFRKGPMVFGFAGSFRVGQLLRHRLVVPPQPPGLSDDEYLCTLFINALHDCMDAGHCNMAEGVFLLGYRGKLYNVGGDYQVGKSRHPYEAIGSGGDIATGVLRTLCGSDMTPKDVLIAALEASQEFNAGVRGPFVVVEG